MEKTHLIPADEFCTHYQVEYTFINNLEQHGLLQITHIEEGDFIDSDELQKIEKLLRLHFDLDINLEGAEVIFHLLQKLNDMNDEIRTLRNRLEFYEKLG